jgi:hypothetical protein
MRPVSIRTVLAVLLLGSVAIAQSAAPKPVSVTGLIVPTPGPVSICQQNETHRIACTDVFLKSSTIDLHPWVGKIATVIGKDVGVTCTVVDVTAIQSPAATLSMCGAPNLACPIKVQICPSGAIGIYGIFAAADSAFVPVNLYTGSFLLSFPFVELAQGIQQFPRSGFQVQIPMTPALVGVEVHLQGFLQDIGPVSPPVLTNPICFTIGAFSMCMPIQC